MEKSAHERLLDILTAYGLSINEAEDILAKFLEEEAETYVEAMESLVGKDELN